MYQRKESSGGSYIGSGDSHNGVRVAIKLAASKTLATSKKGEKSAPQRAFGRRRCNPRCVNLILTIAAAPQAKNAAAAHTSRSERSTKPTQPKMTDYAKWDKFADDISDDDAPKTQLKLPKARAHSARAFPRAPHRLRREC